MENMDENLYSLIRWMDSITPTEGPSTLEDIIMGKRLAKALMNIDPEYFSDAWYSKMFDEKIQIEDLNVNWRLKSLILKKILKSMTDYYESTARRHIPDANLPDLQAAARDSSELDLCKMMQIVVAIAVNCPNRASIIANISNFDQNIQNSVMLAIQELEGEKNSGENFSTNYDEDIKNLHVEISDLREANENLTIKCQEQATKIMQLIEEKKLLLEEKQHIESAPVLKSSVLEESDRDEFCKKISGVQKRLDDAEEEIFRLEHARDELNARLETMLRENKDLQAKLESSNSKEEEVQKLRDELEELRIKSVEYKKMSATLETYKRKLDESNQLKNELKNLQDKSSVLMNCAIDLEEEKRRSSVLKIQMDAYKRQLDEIEANKQHLDFSNFQQENIRLKEELKNLICDRERAASEKNSAKDFKDEMRMLESADASSAENKMESLESRLRSKDLELLTMEEKFKTALYAKDMELTSVGEKLKIWQQSKDSEMKSLEDKYKSYLEKAKTVIVELEKSQSSGGVNGNSYGRVEFEGLRKELEEKEKLIQKMQEEQERMRIMKEQEDRLITTSFHEMGMQLHRDASEKRMAAPFFQTTPPFQAAPSFLSKQRQITEKTSHSQTHKKDQNPPSRFTTLFR